MRPDRFRAVIGLSLPLWPPLRILPPFTTPKDEHASFHPRYFHDPGAAERELEQDVRQTVRRLLHSTSGSAQELADRWDFGMVPPDGGFLASMVDHETLPFWLTESDVDFFVAEFERTGFSGGLNWYRNIPRNFELLALFGGARVTVPELFMAGQRDPVITIKTVAQLIVDMPSFVPELRGWILLPNCGHWTQQECPEEVNEAMINFLHDLG